MTKKSSYEKSKISEIPESHQRYLDEILSISRKKKGGWVTNKEIAENLKVEPASVSGMLEKLRKKRLINWEPRKSIRLTEKGTTQEWPEESLLMPREKDLFLNLRNMSSGP